MVGRVPGWIRKIKKTIILLSPGNAENAEYIQNAAKCWGILKMLQMPQLQENAEMVNVLKC